KRPWEKRFLLDTKERALEVPRAQKAEPLELSDQVRSGPHRRRSPEEAKDGLAKKLQERVSHPEVLRIQATRPLDVVVRERWRIARRGVLLDLRDRLGARNRHADLGKSEDETKGCLGHRPIGPSEEREPFSSRH